ncbi:Os11g0197850 [Oryza sativa Japonica Group]|uniref:Os11g0197850 protein n=1 Tax=Oryza sativa subsp. japonica TaxID=39947 RepID=A0A0P0XZU6_ORYSJ|nr:Os11g0197850 [Oryza sativa Japonica Group]
MMSSRSTGHNISRARVSNGRFRHFLRLLPTLLTLPFPYLRILPIFPTVGILPILLLLPSLLLHTRMADLTAASFMASHTLLVSSSPRQCRPPPTL